jgi:hypothetical protein
MASLEGEEFLAAMVAIHKYMLDSRERPPEIRRGFSHWKLLSRSLG